MDVSWDEGHVDWLAEIEREGGEFAWIRRSKNFFIPKKKKSLAEVNAAVLKSRSVRAEIAAEITRRGGDAGATKTVNQEARQILDEMAHNFQLGAVKPIGYAVLKVVKRIFKSIFVNLQKLDEIRGICEQNVPIVFMPTHKSYMDFLLISLLCFDRCVPLPAICAGEDFRASALLGGALRRCGAFFIRRTFGNDKLYWSIFSEYVQIHLTQNLRPVEFFVEGQRSRSSKSLYPKNGLFQTVLQPFFASEVFDIMLIPVTINYDKFLEESLYGRELLGFPKPKETASGLFKAREILRENFGNIYVTFAHQISVRAYFSAKFAAHALRIQNSFTSAIKFPWNEFAREEIRCLAHNLLQVQNNKNILTIWPFVCIAILQKRKSGSSIILLSEILQIVRRLQSLLNRLQIPVKVLGESVTADLRYFMDLHKNLLQAANESEIALNCESYENFTENLMKRLILFNYANLAFCSVVNSAFIAISVLRCQKDAKLNISDLFDDFQFLEKIFDREFICVPNETKNVFGKTLQILHNANLINMDFVAQTVQIGDLNLLKLLQNMFECWVECYIIIFRACYRILSQPNANIDRNTIGNAAFVSFCRDEIFAILKSGRLLRLFDNVNDNAPSNENDNASSNVENADCSNKLRIGNDNRNTLAIENDNDNDNCLNDLRITCLSVDTVKNALASLKERVFKSNANTSRANVLKNIQQFMTRLETFVPHFSLGDVRQSHRAQKISRYDQSETKSNSKL